MRWSMDACIVMESNSDALSFFLFTNHTQRKTKECLQSDPKRKELKRFASDPGPFPNAIVQAQTEHYIVHTAASISYPRNPGRVAPDFTAPSRCRLLRRDVFRVVQRGPADTAGASREERTGCWVLAVPGILSVEVHTTKAFLPLTAC